MTVYIADGSFLDSESPVLPAVSWVEPSVPPSAATAAA